MNTNVDNIYLLFLLISLLNQRKIIQNTNKKMKAISKWEFKCQGYIKYLCANLSMEPFYVSFINVFFFFPCTLLPFSIATYRLPVILVSHCGGKETKNYTPKC